MHVEFNSHALYAMQLRIRVDYLKVDSNPEDYSIGGKGGVFIALGSRKINLSPFLSHKQIVHMQ
tara:strand:+ start:586 stop:777 length:192 start_codon:yes stop_codon:yes gene_type:complete